MVDWSPGGGGALSIAFSSIITEQHKRAADAAADRWMMMVRIYLFVNVSVGHTVINGDQIYPAVQPYANFGQYQFQVFVLLPRNAL